MTTASSLERTGDLSLYGTISMSLVVGLLVGLIVLALLDRGGDNTAPIAPLLVDARADQLARHAVLGTPTSEQPLVTRMDVPPRGTGIMTEPGRHRRIAAVPRVSLVAMGLSEALAQLTIDRVKRNAEHAEFTTLLSRISMERNGT